MSVNRIGSKQRPLNTAIHTSNDITTKKYLTTKSNSENTNITTPEKDASTKRIIKFHLANGYIFIANVSYVKKRTLFVVALV